jgi:hypothetical protein
MKKRRREMPRSTGIVENKRLITYWSIEDLGLQAHSLKMEYWSDGVLEYWSTAKS